MIMPQADSPADGLAKALGVRPYYDRWDSRARAAGSGHPELPRN
jgi:hypothetical protein